MKELKDEQSRISERTEKIGIQEGMELEVHSSLSSLGYVECGEPPVKPWYTIQDMAYQKGIIKDGYIGTCKYMFFDIWGVVSLYRKELETNPFKLYGILKT